MTPFLRSLRSPRSVVFRRTAPDSNIQPPKPDLSLPRLDRISTDASLSTSSPPHLKKKRVRFNTHAKVLLLPREEEKSFPKDELLMFRRVHYGIAEAVLCADAELLDRNGRISKFRKDTFAGIMDRTHRALVEEKPCRFNLMVNTLAKSPFRGLERCIIGTRRRHAATKKAVLTFSSLASSRGPISDQHTTFIAKFYEKKTLADKQFALLVAQADAEAVAAIDAKAWARYAQIPPNFYQRNPEANKTFELLVHSAVEEAIKSNNQARYGYTPISAPTKSILRKPAPVFGYC